MKYLKILALAAAAALALTALLGAGSASATVLCKTYVTPCPAAWDYPAGTEIHASLAAGSSATLRDTSGKTLKTCTDSTLKGKTTNTGSATETVDGNIESLTFTGCSSTTHVLANGQFEIHYIGPNTRGQLTLKGVKVTTVSAGVSCTYGTGSAAPAGTMTAEEGMETAEIDLETVMTREAGGFLCPVDAVWVANYKITAPKPLFFKNATV